MTSLSALRQKVEQAKGRRLQLISQVEENTSRVASLEKQQKRIEKAQIIVKKVGLETQQLLQFHINEAVTVALSSVFDNPYELDATFVERRGKTECDLFLKKDDTLIDPLSASGGGVVDVVSFALRVAAWTLSTPGTKTRPVFVLDEPFTHLSSTLLPQACELLARVSHELGIQIIVVTHAEGLIERADKVFTVSKNLKGVSKVLVS